MSRLPGFESGRSVAPREVVLTDAGSIRVPIVVDGELSIDGGNADFPFEIRPGWLMGRTASGRWTPCKRTRANGASGGTSNAVVVHNAAAFRVGDAIDIGAATNRNVVAVDYATNTITFDGSAASWSDAAAVAARDGSQTCRGVLLDFVRLRNGDDQPAHKSAGILIQGAVRTERLLGDVAAVRADSDAKLAGVRFSDEHGQ